MSEDRLRARCARPYRFLLLALLAPAALAAGYRLDLEINPIAPFPFLGKFGEVEVSIFPGGISGQALFLKGYSKNGEASFRIVNRISRMYADMPLSQIRSMLLTLSRSENEILPGLAEFPISPTVVTGTVSGIPAKRYRVILGESWIDVWTTTTVPRNPQFDRLVSAAIGAVSKSSENLLNRIPGTVIYVEMNTQKFHKLPLLRVKKLMMSSEGEEEALQTGSFYLKAPFTDFFLK